MSENNDHVITNGNHTRNGLTEERPRSSTAATAAAANDDEISASENPSTSTSEAVGAMHEVATRVASSRQSGANRYKSKSKRFKHVPSKVGKYIQEMIAEDNQRRERNQTAKSSADDTGTDDNNPTDDRTANANAADVAAENFFIDRKQYEELVEKVDHLQSYAEYLQTRHDAKIGDIMRLRNNVDFLRYECAKWQDKLKEKTVALKTVTNRSCGRSTFMPRPRPVEAVSRAVQTDAAIVITAQSFPGYPTNDRVLDLMYENIFNCDIDESEIAAAMRQGLNGGDPGRGTVRIIDRTGSDSSLNCPDGAWNAKYERSAGQIQQLEESIAATILNKAAYDYQRFSSEPCSQSVSVESRFFALDMNDDRLRSAESLSSNKSTTVKTSQSRKITAQDLRDALRSCPEPWDLDDGDVRQEPSNAVRSRHVLQRKPLNKLPNTYLESIESDDDDFNNRLTSKNHCPRPASSKFDCSITPKRRRAARKPPSGRTDPVMPSLYLDPTYDAKDKRKFLQNTKISMFSGRQDSDAEARKHLAELLRNGEELLRSVELQYKRECATPTLKRDDDVVSQRGAVGAGDGGVTRGSAASCRDSSDDEGEINYLVDMFAGAKKCSRNSGGHCSGSMRSMTHESEVTSHGSRSSALATEYATASSGVSINTRRHPSKKLSRKSVDSSGHRFKPPGILIDPDRGDDRKHSKGSMMTARRRSAQRGSIATERQLGRSSSPAQMPRMDVAGGGVLPNNWHEPFDRCFGALGQMIRSSNQRTVLKYVIGFIIVAYLANLYRCRDA